MKILVVSDSHGDTNALTRAAAIAGPDLILHLGDHDRDCAELRILFPNITIRAVRGNCDGGSREIEDDEFVVGGKRIFMTHGHLYGVKLGIDRLVTAAMYREADAVLFGHTHRWYAEELEGMLILNPGSIGRGEKTYAVLNIEHGGITHEIFYLDMQR